MAAIDIRANVTCSLGTLISGSLSDDYLQNSGLVMTRGNCEIEGIHTPAVGTGVTFAYSGAAGNQTIPRQLMVLSSFADPYRSITKVELGCRLTYMKDASPAPTVDGGSTLETGRRQQCLNGYIDYPANSVVGYPISASALMDRCLAGIGITASSNPLTNRFNRESIDLSAGYVQVLGDLLLSEGYAGYMDAAGTLQVRDLSIEGGSGPQVSSDHIVDLDAIGVGDLPGEAVIVRYNSTKLKGDLDPTDTTELEQRNWEEDVVEGAPQAVEVRFQAGNAASVRTATYIPYAKTITEYGNDDSFDNARCYIAGREGADLSNSVIRRETQERTVLGVAAANYCTELLSAGLEVDISMEGTIRKVEQYEYDGAGELIKLTSETYEPRFKWLGGIDIDYVYYDANGTAAAVAATSSEVLVERTIEEYWKVFDESSGPIYLKAGETYDPPILAQKTRTAIFQNWTLTQSGQQGAAQIKESVPFETVGEATGWLNGITTTLTLVDLQVRTERPRDSAGQVRAAAEVLLAQEGQQKQTETVAQITYAMGSAAADRFKSFSMPYQSDDIYLSSGVVSRGNAASKALRFGRIQNRLLLGNRNGVNLQLHPSKMPTNPFDPLYLTQGGLTVQYRANGIAWAFDSNGVVASVDALYWGVAGGTGTPWVPVAPGVTTFPPAPPVVGGEIDVPAVVPPWNESIPFEGVTRTVAEIKGFPYKFGPISAPYTLPPFTYTRAFISESLGHEYFNAVTRTGMDVVESGGPPPAGDLTVVAGDALPVLGTGQLSDPAGGTPVSVDSSYTVNWDAGPNGFEDDGLFSFTLDHLLSLDAVSYSDADFCTNGYIQFPSGGDTSAGYYNGAINEPSLDKIQIAADDWVAYLALVKQGPNFTRYRAELATYGNRTSDVASSIFEVQIFARLPDNTQLIEVRFGVFDPANPSDQLRIATENTALATATITANSSYVFLGNADGTVWTVQEHAHVENRIPEPVQISLVTRTAAAVEPATELSLQTRTRILMPPGAYFTAFNYLGDGTASHVISTDDVCPGLVWTKVIAGTVHNRIGSPVMGVKQATSTSDTAAPSTTNKNISFLEYGSRDFTVGSWANLNGNGANISAWVFGIEEPPTVNNSGTVPTTLGRGRGFSVFKFNGDNSYAASINIPHGLGVAPDLIFIRRYSSSAAMYISGPLIGVGQSLELAISTATSPIKANAFYQGADAQFMQIGQPYTRDTQSNVGWAFANTPGHCQVGSFDSTGTVLQAINVGFQPSWVMIKAYDGGFSSWPVRASNLAGAEYWIANTSGALTTSYGTFTVTATGFEFTGSFDDTGVKWIYVAYA